MNDITVLSTACGAIFMPGFFRCLRHNKERKIRIIGCDAADSSYLLTLLDGYYHVPAYTDPDYIDTILEICKKEKVDILFPHISMELSLFRERINDFRREGIKVAISEEDSLSIANNKYELYEFMRFNNLEVPEYYLVDSTDSLTRAACRLGYPEQDVCVKVAESSGSRGVRLLSIKKSKAQIFLHEKPNSFYTTLEDMCQIVGELETVPQMLLMKALPGCEYTVDLLANKGKVVYIAGRRNIVSSMSIAQESVVEKKAEAYDLCTAIVEMLKLDGNIGFDFMLDENDNPVLTDLNPRITATIVLYVAAGINFPYLRVKQLLNEPLPVCSVSYGVRLVRKYDDILIKNDAIVRDF